MKIICPHCEIQGSVDDSLAGKKLRCPKCSKVFLVGGDTPPETSDDDLQSPEIIAPPEPEATPDPPAPLPEEMEETEETELPENEEELEIMGEEDDDDGLLALMDEDDISSDLKTCSVCSQSFAPEFLVEKDSKLYCAMCEPTSEDEEEELAFDNDSVTASEEIVTEEDDNDETLAFAMDEDSDADEAQEKVALQPCSKCGESLHPEFLDTFDGKLYCAFCLPEDKEENLELTDDSIQEEGDEDLSFETDTLLKAAITEPPETTSETDVSENQERVDIEDEGEDVETTEAEEKEELSVNATDFTVGEVLKEAWQKTKGAKGTLWAAFGVMYLILIAVSFGGSFAVSSMFLQDSPGLAMGLNGTLQLLSSWLSLVFTAGVILIGVHKARKQPTSWKTVFGGFSGSKIVAITIASFLQLLLIGIGFILLIIPGIYLTIGYGLTLPLIMDKGLGPWEALETSRKTIHKKWWTVFGVYVVMMLLYMVSAVPLGIGLIWTIPMFMLAVGVVYVRFFGTSDTDEQDVLEIDEETEVESEESV